ncbi:hypothetical protein ACHAXS_001265, partial [Conticribra weissflogii]
GTKPSLSDAKVEILNAIGFNWGKKKDVWNDRFVSCSLQLSHCCRALSQFAAQIGSAIIFSITKQEELKQIWKETGSSSFPTRGDKNKTLGKWITTQR